MGHLVQYRTAAGEPASEDVVELEDALALAARLRNDERAEDVRVFAEVPLRFETYVKVSVAAEDEAEVADPADPADAVVAEVDASTPENAAAVEPPPGAMPLGPVVAGGRGASMFQGS